MPVRKTATRARARSARRSTPRPAAVGIWMGSRSDWAVMQGAVDMLEALGIAHEVRIASAHRTPERVRRLARGAEARGLQVVIAGAGGAAHLAGVVAAQTLLPVLGVPINSSPLRGLDALLATVQMPGGVPVGTLSVGIAGAKNAALLAAAILARQDPTVRERLATFRRRQAAAVPKIP